MPPKPSKGNKSLGSDAQVPSTSNGGQTGANIPPKNKRKNSNPQKLYVKEPLLTISGSGAVVKPEDVPRRQLNAAFRPEGVLQAIRNRLTNQYAQAKSTDAKVAILRSEVAHLYNRIDESYPVKHYNMRMIQELVDANQILPLYEDFVKIYSTVAKEDPPMMVLQFVLEEKFGGVSNEDIAKAHPLNVEKEKEELKKLATNLQRHLIPQIDNSMSSLQQLKTFTEAVKELMPLLENARTLREDSANLAKTLEQFQLSSSAEQYSTSLTQQEENEIKMAALAAIVEEREADFLNCADVAAIINKKNK